MRRRQKRAAPIKPGRADIATACMLRFVSEAHPGLIDVARDKALAHHSARAEALSAFSAVMQIFDPPR